ncbi:hypothetical protein EA658_09850 [Pseudoxanthomonas winnipegensis]|uniref:Uncharacterized protein n=1 Tax=Pseudoxanthomonas winnipegensis TaxID=2480810 RepID=A0ABY1WCU7_9GAMM|nr:hypothetical protein [Pseudoxanthomonas winnipegensis]TAA12462.1 hypothetical protein EA659_03800 [Pseudoxanthomonas winnipegensis]TAA19173.1 hypothetical protein EA658_09850 [Pseudoxanthomonas winnipegensis]TAH70434.1 hypothetical protein EA657_16915 [Pseudoxanthomonas winnipegensis]
MSESHIVKNSDLAIARLEQRVAEIEKKLDQLLLATAGEKSVERAKGGSLLDFGMPIQASYAITLDADRRVTGVAPARPRTPDEQGTL